LVLDQNGHIFAEYIRYLSLAGEPGMGDVFMRWVNDHQHNESFCTLIPLTISSGGEILEFPNRESLSGFDPSDKKFVAVAAAHPEKPPIQAAVDRGWVRYREALAEAEVRVELLCPKDIRS
jgi:hypothetical protein